MHHPSPVNIHIRFNIDIRVLADLLGESNYKNIFRLLETNPYPAEKAFLRYVQRLTRHTEIVVGDITFFCIEGFYARFTVEMRGSPDEFIRVMSDKGLLRSYRA